MEYVRYYYDDFGLLADIHHPNGLIEKYQYSAATEERLRRVMYQSSNLTVAQYLDDIDSNNLYYGSHGNIYHLTYQNGKLSSVAYNNQEYIWMSYYPTIYNGHVVYDRYYTYTSNSYNFYKEYDAFGRITIDDKLFYEYDDFSNITSIQDTSLNIVNSYTTYQYNYFNDLTNINVQPNGLSLENEYDDYRRLVKKTYKLNNTTILGNDYSYHSGASLEKVIKNATISIYLSTPNSNPIVIDAFDEVDGFSRISSQHISISGMRTNKLIFYCSGGSDNDLTNFRVKTVVYSNDVVGGPLFGNIILQQITRRENYYYDSLGNITKIENATSPLNIIAMAEYYYDALSRLIRENNKAFNKTYVYSYDYRGNIVSKEEYALTTNQSPSSPLTIHTYTYDSVFLNRLISYDNEPFEYDNMGNPTTYRGKTMSWIRGTLLQSVVDNNNNSVSFVYDGFKQRIRKEANNVTTSYSYINGQLVLEQKGNQTIKYFYAHDGIVGFALDDVIYFYEKNIQGDVITIRDINRSVVAKYEYDAWGNHIVKDSSNSVNTSSSFVGNINPIRYRSYYYDVDLKMYWLTTRYYDPEIGRFISPDHYSYLSIKKLHGINLYAYSRNNPVMYYDPSGHFPWLILLAVAVCAIVLATTLKSDSKTTKQPDKNEIPTGDDTSDYDMDNPYKGDGFIIYYKVNENKDSNVNSLKVYKSWRFSSEEMRAFLEFLQGKYKDAYINIDKIMNEWVWHNIAYSVGFKPDQSGSLDAFFNHDDVDHWYSFILNWRLWY